MYTKKSRGIGGKSIYSRTEYDLVNRGTSITSGGDVSLASGNDSRESLDKIDTTSRVTSLTADTSLSTVSAGDTTFIGSHLNAENVSISSGGTLNLLAAADTSFEERKKTTESVMWQAQEGKGHTSTTYNMVSINAANVAFDADKINVDVAAGLPRHSGTEAGEGNISSAIQHVIQQANASNTEPSVQQLVTAAATQPGLSYLNQLQNNPNVNWNVVNDAYNEWEYETQGLTPEGAAIIAIAVTIVTSGAGAAIVGAGTTAGGTAAAAGTAATTAGAATAGTVVAGGAATGFSAAAIGTAAANAAFSTLAAQATIALVNNQGNIGDALKDLGSSDNVKALAFAALTAGATQGLANAAGLPNIAVPDMTIGQQAMHIGINAGVSTVGQSVIYGEDFGSTLVNNLLTSTVAVAGAEAASEIGGLYNGGYGVINEPTHLLLHAGLGCAVGAVDGNCAGGAVGAAVGEGVADFTGNTTLAEFSGALGGLLTGTGAEGVYAGYGAAQNAVQNNFAFTQYTTEEELDAVRDAAFGTTGTLIGINGEPVGKTEDGHDIFYNPVTEQYFTGAQAGFEVGFGIVFAGFGGALAPVGSSLLGRVLGREAGTLVGAEAAGSSTFLYRAVNPDELLDLQTSGMFRNLGSAEGKYFTTSAEDAAFYGKQAVTAFGDQPYSIVRTQISDDILEGLSSVSVDRGIPAWVIPDERLPLLKPDVLNYSPIPPRR